MYDDPLVFDGGLVARNTLGVDPFGARFGRQWSPFGRDRIAACPDLVRVEQGSPGCDVELPAMPWAAYDFTVPADP